MRWEKQEHWVLSRMVKKKSGIAAIVVTAADGDENKIILDLPIGLSVFEVVADLLPFLEDVFDSVDKFLANENIVSSNIERPWVVERRMAIDDSQYFQRENRTVRTETKSGEELGCFQGGQQMSLLTMSKGNSKGSLGWFTRMTVFDCCSRGDV